MKAIDVAGSMLVLAILSTAIAFVGTAATDSNAIFVVGVLVTAACCAVGVVVAFMYSDADDTVTLGPGGQP